MKKTRKFVTIHKSPFDKWHAKGYNEENKFAFFTEDAMQHYEMTIAGVRHALPLCRLNDDLMIGAFVIFGNVELTRACATELLKRLPEYDYLITAEAKGIPLCYEMARQTNADNYFIARKKPKAYMTGVFDVEVQSITTSGLQHLYLDVADAEIIRGKRIVIIDDVISTGESLAAVEKLVEQAGGNIVAKAAVLAEGDAAKRTDVIFLNELPLFDKNGNPI